jgi:RNA polymerase sigma-70 factor (ECF subfamily)
MASIEGCSLASVSTKDIRSETDSKDLANRAALADLPYLVAAYSALLFRVAHSVLRSRAEAEDVVQDVFVRVLKHHRSLQDVRNPRVWLIRIAWNLAIDHKRRIRPDQMDHIFAESLIASSMQADEAMEQTQRMKTVLRELERLPKGERHVLLLSAIEELSTAEMAQVLGKSESAIRALLFRARTRLRRRLEGKEQ